MSDDLKMRIATASMYARVVSTLYVLRDGVYVKKPQRARYTQHTPKYSINGKIYTDIRDIISEYNLRDETTVYTRMRSRKLKWQEWKYIKKS